MTTIRVTHFMADRYVRQKARLFNHCEHLLPRGGFGNFVTGKATIGSREVVTLDFDKPSSGGKTWYCRQYFFVDGPLGYDLGFGT
ncbi:MAG: hypothetical protein WAN79_04730 [Opitutaceae bacterium]